MIGVCIKYFHENYGGMLQAYATTMYLEELGVDYELIRYDKRKNIFQKIKNIPRLFNKILLNDKIEGFKKKVGLKLHKDFAKNNRLRMKSFHKFCNQKFINLSPIYSSYQDMADKSSIYDIVLTGSDQLWSPAGLPTNFYNLEFCKNGVKRISYASSFGVSYIPWYQKRRTADFLKKFDFISMREIKGAKIVKELIGKEVPEVADPVFLINKEKWDTLIPNFNRYHCKYIFAYFLGNTKEYREKVTEFAKERGLKIVTLRHLDQYVKEDEKFGDYAPYDIGPEEFLNLIRNAEYVFTDSFHGSCFSIINHKKFLTFNRYSNKSKVSKNSRIDTLMANIGINRRYNGAIEDVLADIDYSTVDQRLNDLIVFSKQYLCNALEVDYDSNNK